MLNFFSTIINSIKNIISALNITYIVHGCLKILNFILEIKKESDLKKKEERINKANQAIEDACNNGTLSDLLNATKEIGKEND